jgi:heme exporter protein CcmD
VKEVPQMDFDMGKYVVFVWGSYGISAVALIALAVISLKAHSRLKRELQALTELKNQAVSDDQ